MRFLKIILLSVLISLSCSYVVMAIAVFREGVMMSGSDLFEEIGLAICLGLAIGFISLIFHVERIPVIGQFIIHAVAIIGCVFVAGYFGDWYDVTDGSTIVYVLTVFVIIYVGAWSVMQVMLKQDVNQLNERLQQRRGGLK